MKIQTVLILVVSLFVFANCQTSEEGTQEEQQIQQENTAVQEGWEAIMVVHDEIMPISMKLPPMWEALDTLKNTVDEATATAMKENATTLQKVHKDMYDWMDESGAIRERLDNAAADELNTFIEEEKLRISQIKEETVAAYETAQELLKTDK